MRPLNKVKLQWSPEFAYAIGLLTTDGSLSKDGRHIDFTSKDREQIETFKNCLGIKNITGQKGRGGTKEKKYFHVQFGDVNFYRFLMSIGLTPNKSKTIGKVNIPQGLFYDFLRGCFDGDGTFYSYWDPRWRSSFMFYTVFISASLNHIEWLRQEIARLTGALGHLNKGSSKRLYYQLKYAKSESMNLLKKIYYSKDLICLSRKRLKIEKALSIIGESL